MKKVMVFGTFDVLHKGHLSLFSQTRKYGDFLIAVVARDSTVKDVKGKSPRNDELKRLSEVEKHVDKAVLGYVYDKMKIVKKLKPDVICIGYDQKNFVDELKKFKINTARMKPYMPHIYKSSKIKNRHF